MCRRGNCGFHLLGLEFVGIELLELKWISEFLLKHLYPFPKILDLGLGGGCDHCAAASILHLKCCFVPRVSLLLQKSIKSSCQPKHKYFFHFSGALSFLEPSKRTSFPGRIFPRLETPCAFLPAATPASWAARDDGGRLITY